MLKVAAYCRVSTDNEDQINSLDSQVIYFTDYINNNKDWSLVKVYADEGITGTNIRKREEFRNMLDQAYNGKIDLIVTKEVSRFARNTVDALNFTRKLKSVGVGVIFINDNIDTRDTDGEFRLTIMASVAQEESRKTSERVKWGMKRKMEQGYVFVNSVFGYDAEKGKLLINEEEAKTVRMIFNKFVYEGKGAYTISKEMILDKIPVSKRITRWSPTAITRILKNEKYAGDLLQKKTYTPDFLEHKSVKNNGYEDKIFIPNHHEPIIDRETWNLAKEQFEKRTKLKETKSRYSSVYWCSGKIFCGICGSSCIVKAKTLKNEKYIAWRCKEAAVYGKTIKDVNDNLVGCTNGQINMKALNSCIQFAFKRIIFNKQAILTKLFKEINKTNNDVESSNELQKWMDKLKNKKDKILQIYLEDVITKEEMLQMREKIDKEIEALNTKIDEIKNKNNCENNHASDMENIKDKIKSILDQDTITTEIYRQIVDHIVLYPTHDLEIYFKYVSEPISIHYITKGKGENYKTICWINKENHMLNLTQ
ncbi:recombinase family protein [Anaerovorax odorimutans]|uniref:recombinase family protein n=1 Tax=Anaerovorax odorimutans TaxID=109327 RepID=UPI0004041780|nr:recombinase family protein [Anaerovorax odorimutans]